MAHCSARSAAGAHQLPASALAPPRTPSATAAILLLESHAFDSLFLVVFTLLLKGLVLIWEYKLVGQMVLVKVVNEVPEDILNLVVCPQIYELSMVVNLRVQPFLDPQEQRLC